MTRALVAALLVLGAVPARAGVASLWAVSDGEKVERDDRASPWKGRNSVWDGQRVRLFGARNEIVAFQVMVESDAQGIEALRLSLPELRQRGGASRIAYAAPAADPTDTVGRPIQIFPLHYMNVTETTHATWAWALRHPKMFAAIVPVAGLSEDKDLDPCVLKDMPIWAFHGDQDDVVDPQQGFAIVKKVDACKGSVRPKMTIYPQMTHGSWEPAYDDPAMWRWLLEQRRSVPAPGDPQENSKKKADKK